MKVYKFYIKRKYVAKYIGNRTLNESNKDTYVLYAMTTEKKYAKRFKHERNMKRFRIVVSDDMSKEEIKEFRRKNVLAELDLYELVTFDRSQYIEDENEYVPSPEYVRVLCTANERQVLDSILEEGGIMNLADLCYTCPALFKNKYYKALKTLQYVAAYKMICAQDMPDAAFYWINGILKRKDPENYEEYDSPNIKYDELQIFIELVTETL